MLDLEIVSPAVESGLDIVSVDELKRRLRLSNSSLNDVVADAIIEAGDAFHGMSGELRRSIFPTTYKRWLTRFPDLRDDRGRVIATGRGVIPLPLPPLLRVVEIVIEDGSSPADSVDPSLYVVRTGTLVGEIELKAGSSWPDYAEGPRAISITYEAGYTAYPATLKRAVAIKAAHNFLNSSATINDPRVLKINREIQFGLDDFRKQFAIPHDHSDWGE